MNIPKISNEEEAMAAVRQDGSALEYVPDELKTAELCFEAMKQPPYWAFQYVPDELKTTEYCLKAMRYEPLVFFHLSEELKTAELCLEAVKMFDLTLLAVPEKLLTAELCLEAVKSCGGALAHVPDELMTVELCLEAVKQGNFGYRLVNNEPRPVEPWEFIPEELRAEVRSMLASWVADRKNGDD